MKKRTKIFYCNVALLLLVLSLTGCKGGTNESSKTASSENDSALESQEAADKTQKKKQTNVEEDESVSTKGSEESAKDDSSDTSSSNKESANPSDHALSGYSSEKIEYARVWLQLGPNQEIDELNVRHISAGEPINPNDDTSASYPEDVVQLAGSRLVDGSVTYSSNGDGTIHVYNVPLRWESSADVDKNFMKEYTEGIIKNTKVVDVDPGNNKEIVKLIDIMNIH
ncbi:hypothetical protein [Bacillus glycinifermentans]|uniref:hypothetical protein n=1 Tax=Bacillus glycinifermentans TaxID=1664069 RepID=UPI000BC2CF88|nr:hypothetical protein [Bacillus glycinifermentans]ATH91775.1 hypothetical protein COP00_03395 [Bacillus glycinifermentans]